MKLFFISMETTPGAWRGSAPRERGCGDERAARDSTTGRAGSLQAVSPQLCGSHTAPGEIFAAEGFLQQLELKRHEQGLGSLPAARGRLGEDAHCRRGALCPSL